MSIAIYGEECVYLAKLSHSQLGCIYTAEPADCRVGVMGADVGVQRWSETGTSRTRYVLSRSSSLE